MGEVCNKRFSALQAFVDVNGGFKERVGQSMVEERSRESGPVPGGEISKNEGSNRNDRDGRREERGSGRC